MKFYKCKYKSFEELVEQKASCAEFALNGFLRIYEEGEENTCECVTCKRPEKKEHGSEVK